MNYQHIEENLPDQAALRLRMIPGKNLKKAFLKGYAAAMSGRLSTECPYDHHDNVAGVKIPASYASSWHLGYLYFETT